MVTMSPSPTSLEEEKENSKVLVIGFLKVELITAYGLASD